MLPVKTSGHKKPKDCPEDLRKKTAGYSSRGWENGAIAKPGNDYGNDRRLQIPSQGQKYQSDDRSRCTRRNYDGPTYSFRDLARCQPSSQH